MNAEEVKALTKYRWVILAACCLINLCIGSMYAWSALSAPMAVEIGVNPQDLTIAFSICNAVGFIGMIAGGFITQSYGPKVVMIAGGILYSMGMFLCGFAQSVTHLVLSYGVMLGIGLAGVYGCTISNTIKYFPDKRGMVGGMTTAFYGISSVLFAPLGSTLSQLYGARDTFHILGIALLIIITVCSMLVKTCPEGFIPEGFVPPAAAAKSGSNDKKPGEMLGMPVFYVMMTMLIAGGTFGLMVISNARSLAMNMVGASASTAVLFVSVICLFNTLGRLIAGIMSDKFGRINTLASALVIALIGLALLIGASMSGSMTMFAIGVIMVGICFGTYMGVFPSFTTDQFGTKYNVVNYGIMWIGFSIAGVVGPLLLTTLYSSTGSYTTALVLALALAFVGLAMSFIYRRVNAKAA